jgi:hypothetical protein
MSEHTPGPWTVKPYGRNWGSYHIAEAEISIADMGHDLGVTQGQQDCDLANARLIAAAPDLLKSLTDLIADIVDLANEYEICHEIVHSSYGNAAYAAIAKAKAA